MTELDWQTFYTTVVISNQLLGQARPAVQVQYTWQQEEHYGSLTRPAEWSPDQAGGMLLEELLDQSTLDWLEKVKAKRA